MGAIDNDLDELHRLRDVDGARHDKDITRVESKLDKLTWAAIGAIISGVTMTLALLGNLLRGAL